MDRRRRCRGDTRLREDPYSPSHPYIWPGSRVSWKSSVYSRQKCITEPSSRYAKGFKLAYSEASLRLNFSMSGRVNVCLNMLFRRFRLMMPVREALSIGSHSCCNKLSTIGHGVHECNFLTTNEYLRWKENVLSSQGISKPVSHPEFSFFAPCL